ncbi:MAG: hypothetical protein AAF985_27795 [Bacteroidota bacterium]
MAEKKTNGRETEIQQPQETNQSIIDPGNPGKDGWDSGGVKHQPFGVGGEVDTCLGRDAIYRTLGGILGLFREVIKEGEDYIDDHGERLETRLIQHKQKKASYLEKAAALEREIARLLEQVKELPDDSQLREEE